ESPISDLNILFYNTLFDENASCHMALGRAYPMNLKNGTEMDAEALKANHANDSILHEDFMFGSACMHAVGVTYDGEEIDIIVDGNIVI
ncbi:MAG: aminopeptidase, partial [Bacteroidales bacterium]|nr:aminopeptidase [Bacteroidales bacterium]